MKNLFIDASKYSPIISLNADTGILEFQGKSLPENSMDFYNPVLEWIKEYAKNPHNKTVIKIKLLYFSTSSSKYILKIFKALEIVFKMGRDINVEWYYESEDEEMLESGEEYEILTKLPFEFIEVPSPE
jgi:hypothetical protein